MRLQPAAPVAPAVMERAHLVVAHRLDVGIDRQHDARRVLSAFVSALPAEQQDGNQNSLLVQIIGAENCVEFRWRGQPRPVIAVFGVDQLRVIDHADHLVFADLDLDELPELKIGGRQVYGSFERIEHAREIIDVRIRFCNLGDQHRVPSKRGRVRERGSEGARERGNIDKTFLPLSHSPALPLSRSPALPLSHSPTLPPFYLIFPGPHNARPGFDPVCSPSFKTCAPLTNTCFMPTANWCGCSKVARSATVFGSKTTTSAKYPSFKNPRRSSSRLVAGRPVRRRIASSRGMTFSSRTYLPSSREKFQIGRAHV